MPKERMSDKAAGRCDFPFLNPQTGPFYIEGAEVGDTVAVHFIDIGPDAFGGNMDTPEMKAGVTCYLGVNVEGALLSLGDGHARQGEGETCGVAVECAMNTVIAVDLIKGRPCPSPRIESETHIIFTGSARPLEDAFRIAQADLVHWLAEDYGLETMDAYQLVTQGVLSPLANVCDTNYTSVAKFPRKHLPKADAMGGADAKLRSIAAEYRRMHP
jgi:acetamidase/formamidase